MVSSLSKKNSNINKFRTGNLKTLNKKGVRDVMIDFYNKYYRSENIILSVVSNKKLNNLKKIVENIFNNVPNKKAYNFSIEKPFYSSKPKYYQMIPVSNLNAVIFFLHN